MSVTTDIQEYAKTYVPLSGVTIKRLQLPDNPDIAVAIAQYAGRQPWYTTSQIPGPAYERPNVQVLTRGTKTGQAAAEAMAYTIFNMLSAIINTTVNGVYYVSITPLTSPFSLPNDDSGRPIFCCNYSVIKEASHA